MTTTETVEAQDKFDQLEPDQKLSILLKGHEIKNGKSISKYHKRRHKQFIKKIGLGSLMPRFNKTPDFWKIMASEYIYFDFIQGDFEMPPFILEEMKQLFDFYYFFLPMVPVHGMKLSPADVDLLSFSFSFAVDNSFSEATKVYKACSPLIDTIQEEIVYDHYLETIRKILSMVTRHFSSLHSWNYVAVFEPGKNKHLSSLELRNKITINRKKADVYCEEREYKRRYYQLETSSSYLYKFVTVQSKIDGNEYPVFIQKHALERISERINTPMKYVTNLLFTQVSYRDVRTYKDNLLIPVYANSTMVYKIGYLLGNVRDKRLLIDTFLFISQDGTPEGDKLNELLEINKVEKSYLELDRVEHFVSSTLKEDEELAPLFEACNLSHLFKLYFGKKREETKNAEFIKEMLQIDNSALSENLMSAEDVQKKFMAS